MLYFSENTGSKTLVESKYIEKYSDAVGWAFIDRLIHDYETAELVFVPIRDKLSEDDMDDLYLRIDKSSLSPTEKIEAIIGLMTILAGSFPESRIITILGTLFGKGVLNVLDEKRKEYYIYLEEFIEFAKHKVGNKGS